MAVNKPWTGERLETFVQTENTTEHLHRYALASSLVKGKKVLDIACGEGYGSALLAAYASAVTGVDIDLQTIEKAKSKYKHDNLLFLNGSAAAIPCQENTFDVVVSFETIEHHSQHDEMMLEIKRVLKAEGLLIISSPDKSIYSDRPAYKNPFHVKELYAAEFEALIKKYFRFSEFLGQRSFSGSVLIAGTAHETGNSLKLYQGNFSRIREAKLEAMYLIGIASDREVLEFQPSLFDGQPVLDRQFDDIRNQVRLEIQSSRSFRLGHALLQPIRFLKRIVYDS